MAAANTPTLHPTGSHEVLREQVDGPDFDWRALRIEGLRAIRALALLAGEPSEAQSKVKAQTAGITGYRLIILIALVSTPLSCGAALLTWGVHENRSAANHVRSEERERMAEQARDASIKALDTRIEGLDGRVDTINIDIMKMGWKLDSIAQAVGARMPAKVNDE